MKYLLSSVLTYLCAVIRTENDIRKASLQDIQAYCIDQDWKLFRAKQIYEWVWQKGSTSFEDMTNLSKTMREQLASDWQFYAPEVDLTQRSTDGTIKYRIALHDGFKVEAVLIPVEKDDRYTVCVSSQVGCSLSCAFCATGKMKRSRNLDAAEIEFEEGVIAILTEDQLQQIQSNLEACSAPEEF